MRRKRRLLCVLLTCTFILFGVGLFLHQQTQAGVNVHDSHAILTKQVHPHLGSNNQEVKWRSFGVIYVATKLLKHCNNGWISAQSIRALHQDLPITFFVDESTRWYMEKRAKEVMELGKKPPFDQLISTSAWHLPTHPMDRFSKLRSLTESPYDRTLYLDTDTYMCNGNLTELFSVWLDRFDLVAVPEPHQNNPGHMRPNVPPLFDEVNGGVLLLRKNEQTNRFVRKWEELLLQKPSMDYRDQPPLREALWESNIRFYLMGQAAWNCRGKDSCSKYPECNLLHKHGIGAYMAGERELPLQSLQ
ncbi:hypothetical protein QOT17_000895 [Balamuthia mandrillaris]